MEAFILLKYGFNRKELFELTYNECLEFYIYYFKQKNEENKILVNQLSFIIFESCRVAFHGSNNDSSRLINELKKRLNNESQEEENNIEQQFKDVDFG